MSEPEQSNRVIIDNWSNEEHCYDSIEREGGCILSCRVCVDYKKVKDK